MKTSSLPITGLFLGESTDDFSSKRASDIEMVNQAGSGNVLFQIEDGGRGKPDANHIANTSMSEWIEWSLLTYFISTKC